MKRFWDAYLSTLDRLLAVLFLLCLLTIVSHDILFAGLPELFSWGGELWDLIYQFCLAFAASYIFYLVVVHTKRQRDKENLKPFLRTKTNGIVGDAKSLVANLKDESKYDFEGVYPSLEDTKAMCAALNMFDQAPLILGDLVRYATWMEFLDYNKRRTKDSITRIYATVPFLETEYVRLLTELDNCHYFSILDMTAGVKMKNNPLAWIAGNMQEYFELVQAIETYAIREFDAAFIKVER